MYARLQNYFFLHKHLSHEKKLLNFYSIFLDVVVSCLSRSPVMSSEMSVHLPDLHIDISSPFEGMTIFTPLSHSRRNIMV